MHRRFAALHEQGFGPAAPGIAEYQLAFSILRDAHQMSNSQAGHEAALMLYRAAARLLMSAALLRSSAHADDLQGEIWDRARKVGLIDEPLSLQRALSDAQGEAYLAKLTPAERAKMLEELRSLAQRLADSSFDDSTRLRRLLWTRRLRVAVGAVLLLGGLAWSFRDAVMARNLALHRPVTVSSSEAAYGVDPSHLVDGDELNLGFHTSDQVDATATIDLGAIIPVKRVVVHNRIDCCQERAVPLLLQLSNDGHHFTTTSKRDYRFQEWGVTLPPGSRARFVRLMRKGGGPFHLAEVEVF